MTVIWDATSTLPGDPYGRGTTAEAGRALGLTVQIVSVHGPGEFVSAFEAAKKSHAGMLVVLPSPILIRHAKHLVELAATYRLPAMYQTKDFTNAGGLMAYGPNDADLFARAGVFVSKILKGTRPADLPVEQPTKFELVINLKTAKALGLTIPQSLLVRADQLIE